MRPRWHTRGWQSWRISRLALWVLIVATGAAASSYPTATPPMAAIAGHDNFASVLAGADTPDAPDINAFELMLTPVTNQQFLHFVAVHPEWRRSDVNGLFADDSYLSHWSGSLSLGPEAGPDQPVTRVSWFAARAYCQAQHLRLPTWNEWELAAAAGPTTIDARHTAAWRQEILNWYARSNSAVLPNVGEHSANIYGVKDLHSLVWEWVEDYNSLLISGDSREQGGADTLRFCGAGALTMEQKENYAILMRVAMLSSLNGRNTTRNMGFRCARTTVNPPLKTETK